MIHSLVYGHLYCPHFLEIMNNAVTNIHVQVLYGCMFSFLLGLILEVELLVNSVIIILRNYKITFQSGWTLPPAVEIQIRDWELFSNSLEVSSSSTFSTTGYYSFLDDSCAREYKVASQRGFDLHFPSD